MKTLTTSDLETVTGGKDAPTGPTTSASCNNDQLYSAIQGIQSSLNDLGKNQNNQGLFSNQGLMFMTMALAMRQSANTTVVYGGGCRRNSFTWRASW